MASLLDNLQGAFTSGGFDLSAAVGQMANAAGGVVPQAPSLDQNALSQIGQRLHGAGFDQIGSAASGVLGVASGAGAALAHPDGLLAPLHGAISTFSSLAAPDPHALLATFEQAAAAGDGALGMASLAGPLGALAGARSNPSLVALLALLNRGVPGAVELDHTISHQQGGAAGIAPLIRLVGALMSTEALTRGVLSAAQGIAGMLDGAAADAAIAKLRATATADLAGLVAAAAPDDPDQVSAVADAVTEFTDGIRAASDRLVGGMAFGEATLVSVDFAALGDGITQASGLLNESALGPVRTLATQAAAWVEPILAVDLGSPAASVEAFVGELNGAVGHLAAAVDAIDPASVAQPVSRALATVLAPLHELETVANQVSAALRSALQSAQQAIASIDLRPVTQAIQTAVSPVVDALHDLDQLVGAAQTELQTLATDVTTALGTLRQTLDGVAQTIHDALGRVAGIVEGLHLDQLQSTIQADMQAVANTLASAQVKPYFDTATQAINTTKSVIAAVPLSLLPDDALQELDSAVQPIKDIDFQNDVADVLENQLDAIFTSLDTDILNEVEQAYQEVSDFIESIDPAPALQQLEHDEFDPMLARIRAIDPTEILKPVSDVIDAIKAEIAGIDLRHAVLGPLENAFDELAHAFDQLDPGALLAPVEQQVGQLRDEVTHLFNLPQWQARLALVDPFVSQLLARLDFDALVSLLDAAWQELRPAPAPPGSSALGTVVAGLLEGTGLSLRMDSLGPVLAWIGGADPAAQISARLGDASAAVDAAVAVLERVDPQALVAAVQPRYAALVAALQALPAGSLLRSRLEPAIAAASPVELLGTAVDNRQRYLAALRAAQAGLHALAAAGRSELTAIARGIRDALRPLSVIPERIKALLIRIGLDVSGKTFRELVGELMDRAAPRVLLAPLSPAVSSLKAKLAALVHDVLVAPLGDALTTLQGALSALDISFIRTGLQGIHDQIAADIQQLRPSVVLAGVLTAFDQTKATIAAFDPLAAVRTAINAMKAAIDDVAGHYRPTVLLAPVLQVYADISKALGTLDVHKLLDPVLKALDDIKSQLDSGLNSTASALTGLQAVLP